ncbi:MAG TPA: hypothetical protein VFD66_03585, partial [Verrucomicrobiae bacterium]|nr:hypothetical protein [Verrucomicrobiae bacterium]
QFIRRHKDVLWATDFFTTEVWTPTGLTTFYVLFFIHVQTRRILPGGTTDSPNEAWMKQVARPPSPTNQLSTAALGHAADLSPFLPG